MANSNEAMREALTNLVAYLDKEVRRTEKCKRCKYNGKSFRGEPCWWHVDCGIEDYDEKASDNAMHLLKKFKLHKALAIPRRQCDVGTAEEQMKRQHDTMCNTTKACPDPNWSCRKCFAEWAQMPYSESEAGE